VALHAKKLLALQPDRVFDVFTLAWHVFDDPVALWSDVVSVSDDTGVKSAYLAFLAENGKADLAQNYWAELVGSTGKKPSFIETRRYLQWLLTTQDYKQAMTVWSDLLRAGVIEPDSAREAGELVFNGTFRKPILNAGFDWQVRGHRYVALAFPKTESAGKNVKQVLRIDFTLAHNDDDEPLLQVIPVEANHEYRLVARVRSEEITSDSGPRLRVLDPQCLVCLDVSTENTVGTTNWHDVSLTFASSPQTQVVRVSLWRPRSRVFPMEISGHFWLDSVSLRAVHSVPETESDSFPTHGN
jgi:hypothetical protein